MKILVTGTAGFIGFHLARRLLAEGHEVAGIDSMVPYYDVTLKQRRHAILGQGNGFRPYIVNLADMAATAAVFEAEQPEVIIHLAAQAGVRYALEHPASYVESNVVGSFNLLELARRHPVKHLMLASTSSSYGANTKIPFEEQDPAVTPLTIYAATKTASELMAHAYSHLWQQPITAFRFFTVYGPWGRPDMALYKFTHAITHGQPIDIHNNGDMKRDFTYIDDLIEGIVRLAACIPVQGQPVGDFDSLSPVAPFRLVNIGLGEPVQLLDFIAEIERCVGKPAIRNYLPMQPGEVTTTFANTRLLHALTGFQPRVRVAEGVANFVAWYRDYYGA
jgi:UDP-glucuronate 4-epimerase